MGDSMIFPVKNSCINHKIITFAFRMMAEKNINQ
jgi:hypothetical protein